MLKAVLGVEVISLGFAGLNDNIHALNESVDLAMYELGSKVYAEFFERLGR